MSGSFLGAAPMPLRTDYGGHSSFQQLLEASADDLRDLGASGVASHEASHYKAQS